MLVNFNKPHEVDVPVQDLDDPDDNVFFEDGNGLQDLHGFLNSLDYSEHFGHENQGIFSKIRGLFSRGPSVPSYEFMDGNSDEEFFNIDGDDGENTALPDPGLRKYQIRRLEHKLNLTIVGLVCVVVFVVPIIYFTSGGLKGGVLAIERTILSNLTHNFHPTTLMISLDGFHPHYISEQRTPSLHRMLVDGYGAPYMEPSFPSLTFPNHWTLVTGLYPAEHGIVGNTFYDPQLKKQFINTNPTYGLDPLFWQGGEPIWTTAAKHGVRSAIHMWPGSEVHGVGDNGPLFVDSYNGTEPLSAKTSRVFGWLDTPNIDERPELVLAYVPTIDQFGHKYGISGPELEGALRRVDEFVQLVVDGIAQRNLDQIVNVVVVSDHGMAPTANNRLLFLEDVVNSKLIEHIDGWPLFGLRPKQDVSIDDVHTQIRAKLDSMGPATTDNFHLYRVEEFPPEWHFGGNIQDHRFNYRLAPLWLVPNVGYSITTRASFEQNNNDYSPKGVHGYNNTHLLMRAVFLGQGPYFQAKLANHKKVVPFANVDVYNIVCDTLKIPPSPNNGSQAGAGFSISTANLLPEQWEDHLVYPDLPYEVDHIVYNATYDQLWRPSHKPGSDDAHPESTKSSPSAHDPQPSLPKPSDFLQPSLVTAAPKSATEASTTTSKPAGFFGNLLGGVGDVIDHIDESLEDAVEGAIDYAESWIGGDDNVEEL